jgi:PAS domain S-box-containing protein
MVPARILDHWLKTQLLQQVPICIVVIDREYTIVESNQHFVERFGDWEGRKCYEAYKGFTASCPDCAATQTFLDGQVRIREADWTDGNGRTSQYVVHLVPVVAEDGSIPFVVEMSTDVTEARRWERGYEGLFNQAPCHIAVLDRDFRVVRTNEKFRETFGNQVGKRCYWAYKHRRSKCEGCPAARTFRDGEIHTSSQEGVDRQGRPTYYVVTTAPLRDDAGRVHQVIELSTDVTETKVLQAELREAHDLMQSLIRNAGRAIIATNAQDEVIIYNPPAKEMFGYPPGQVIGHKKLDRFLPAECREAFASGQSTCLLPETTITNRKGEEIPVLFLGTVLRSKGRKIGQAFFVHDLRQIKQLEGEKLEAERLAAVGQTVAGLAHAVKNILMGLEGGMYIVGSGLERKDQERISEGWEVLQRNLTKTTSLVKDFLRFAKGKRPEVEMVAPNDLVREVVDLYKHNASKLGIELAADLPGEVRPAPLDPRGIHTCLTNLMSNAIDACRMSELPQRHVTIAAREQDGTLIFEVNDDGCGMDYQVKQKAFTTFFTTKGGEGTGLGLLTTRKIVQEHGGAIELESEPGKGCTFRMIFPRARLPKPQEKPSDRSGANHG